MKFLAWLLLGVVAVSGCSGTAGDAVDAPSGSVGAKSPATGPPPPPVLKQPEPVADTAQVEAAERVKAEVGVGVKGQRLEDERLVQTIVMPAVALFRTQQRAVFEIQIPQAMNLYQASNGKKPDSEQVFFNEIIKANQIQLPELPPGQRYVYDPQRGELMVERPAGN